MLLAGLTSFFGVLIAAWGSALVARLSPQDLPRSAEIHTDVWVLAFTAGISIITGLVFGLAPAFQIARSNLVDALKEESRGSDGSRPTSSAATLACGCRNSRIALVLLVSSGLLIRSLVRLQER